MKIKHDIKINNIVMLVCTLIFILYNFCYKVTNDQVSSMILLGANYKTFTLGLGEYFRLITCGFCHFNVLHLLANMI